MGFQSFQPKVESWKPLLLRVGEFEDRSFRITFTARDRASSFGHLKQIRRAFFHLFYGRLFLAFSKKLMPEKTQRFFRPKLNEPVAIEVTWITTLILFSTL